MKMSEVCETERPRERMLRLGPGHLSNAELLAILLRTGTKGESVTELSQRLLALAGGSLVKLMQMPLEEVRSVKGLGGSKALPLLAAFELGRRFMAEEMPVEKRTIVAPEQIYRMMIPALKGLRTEECWIVCLNSANYVISRRCMSAGGINATVMDVKEIVAHALSVRAVSLILVHNHPSGNPRPGSEDMRLTAQLKAALAQFNISLVDHVVVSDDSYYSFSDETVYHAKKTITLCADGP